MTETDLATHRADWVAPISHDYGGYTVHEIPPNGQGIIALIALGILEHFDMAGLGVDSPDSVHAQIEAIKLAFADALAYVGDLEYMRLRPAQLLDENYLASRARQINMQRAQSFEAGIPSGGTVYLTVADAEGMMVSMIQSNNVGFGSGVVVSGRTPPCS
jgi:gamma-glutamyltranspeptidase / glutathione hydrolase